MKIEQPPLYPELKVIAELSEHDGEANRKELEACLATLHQLGGNGHVWINNSPSGKPWPLIPLGLSESEEAKHE